MKILTTAVLLIHLSLFTLAQYAPGYYIDSTGNKIPGFLKYTFGGNLFTNKSKGDCRLYYKQDSASDKSTKFTAMDIKGFVIGPDSFTVIRDFRLSSAVYYPQDFCRVLEVGKIKLLQYDAIMPGPSYGSDDIAYWILEKDHKGHSLSSGNFRKIMAVLMEDDPELVQKIKNKEFKFKDTRQIVRSYNEYMSSHSIYVPNTTNTPSNKNGR